MFASLALAYILAWRWQRAARRKLSSDKPPQHFTDRDQLAWQRVEKRIEDTQRLSSSELGEVQYYVDAAREMATELAAIYHPEATDPVGNLTIPEMLAVVELAARDIGEMAKTYLPGGHLLTIDRLRQARKAVDWYKSANNAYWAMSAFIDPIHTVIRYAAAQAGLAKPLQKFQENAFLWLHANFIRRLGHYFIELYSGRLKVGVERYRELLNEHSTSARSESGTILVNADRPAVDARAVTIAVIGQVKAGKSSLINALLEERRAVTDVIPSTKGISRYELWAPDNPSKLVLLDTVGYNQSGPAADEFESTVAVAQGADLLLLVIQATNPARQADVEFWRRLREWFTERPHLKLPPTILVMTHIDLLSPALEWSPPYDWRDPKRSKERSIAEAAAYAIEQLGNGISAVAPVCTAPDKVVGVHEELLPALVQLLGEARAVAFLRCLHAEADERMVRKVFDQLFAAGKALLQEFVREKR
jgi:predicted GTPase